MLRGGICGSATKATPESPKSARHTAFQGLGLRLSPRKSAPIFRAVAVTMDSIMKPVLGTPTGTGLGPTGGMAMQTPTPKISGNALFRCLRSTVTKPRGLVSPSMSRTAPTLAERGQHHGKDERQFHEAQHIRN